MPNNTGTDSSVPYGELKALSTYARVRANAVQKYGDEAACVAEQTRESQERGDAR